MELQTFDEWLATKRAEYNRLVANPNIDTIKPAFVRDRDKLNWTANVPSIELGWFSFSDDNYMDPAFSLIRTFLSDVQLGVMPTNMSLGTCNGIKFDEDNYVLVDWVEDQTSAFINLTVDIVDGSDGDLYIDESQSNYVLSWYKDRGRTETFIDLSGRAATLAAIYTLDQKIVQYIIDNGLENDYEK